MTENTKIQWAHHTFNPWWGCTQVGPGCDHCYAMVFSHRLGKARWGPGEARLPASEKYWHQPLKWNEQARKADKRYRVFCASMADVFDHEAPQEWRERLWALIDATPHLDWMLLTKRIGNVERMVPEHWRTHGAPNVWLGATIVDSTEMARDIEKLAAHTWPAVRFVSHEPGLGSIAVPPSVDWVITGGESGAEAREYNLNWARRLIEQTRGTGTAVFVKQIGTRWARERRLYDSHGGDPLEWPPDLRVREMPEPRRLS